MSFEYRHFKYTYTIKNILKNVRSSAVKSLKPPLIPLYFVKKMSGVIYRNDQMWKFSI